MPVALSEFTNYTLLVISRPHRLGQLLLRAAGLVVLVNLLLAVTLAASPSLHLQVHHDADHADHECVVTHLLQGDFSDGMPPPPVSISIPEWNVLVEVSEHGTQNDVAELWLTNGVLEHGPPVVA